MERRHGDDWFLSSRSNWPARVVDVPFVFLGAGRYRAEIYANAGHADLKVYWGGYPVRLALARQFTSSASSLSPADPDRSA
jgi:hypothetical protein